jgi:tetratricopeptide (TPR) repeat protein
MEAVVGQSSSGRGLRKWLNPVTIGIAIVVVAAVVIGGIALLVHLNASSRQARTVNNAIAASDAAYSKGDYANALSLVRGMEKQATNNKQKADVYQREAQASSSLGSLADAANYYMLKHQADASTTDADAYTLASLYDRLGQKDKALAQYKIALQYAKTHHNQYGSDASAIQAAIDELQGGAQ